MSLSLCVPSQFRRRRAITRSTIGPRLSHVVLTNSTRTRTARPLSPARELVPIRTRRVRPPTPARPNARPRRHRAVTPTIRLARRPPEPDPEDTATARLPRDPTAIATTRIAFRCISRRTYCAPFTTTNFIRTHPINHDHTLYMLILHLIRQSHQPLPKPYLNQTTSTSKQFSHTNTIVIKPTTKIIKHILLSADPLYITSTNTIYVDRVFTNTKISIIYIYIYSDHIKYVIYTCTLCLYKKKHNGGKADGK